MGDHLRLEQALNRTLQINKENKMRKLLFAICLIFASTPILAAECATTITGNDALRFNKTQIVVPKECTTFSVTLKNVGSMPRSVMGHNWVLSTAPDVQSVIDDGSKAGIDDDYVKPNDPRIIASTKLIGGGESDTVKFNTAKLLPNKKYEFFCTCPGHASLMRGDLVISK